MNLAETLKQLSEADGVSGREGDIAAAAEQLLEKYCKKVWRDPAGSILASVNGRPEGMPHILLDAHMDQIGLIVTDITEDGFIRVGAVGGIDTRLLPAQNVRVLGRESIPGVIVSVPPHLAKEGAPQSVEQILVDMGYTKEELEKRITRGDVIVFDTSFSELQNGAVTGRSLDDRAGMLAILYALEVLQEKELPCQLSVLFSVQEEVGEYGAMTAGFALEPDIALAVDVTFAHAHDDDPVKCGKLGKGPMIGISPVLSVKVSNQLMRTAMRHGIPYRTEIMSGETGTNADKLSIARGGVRTCTVSLPLRYMHSPSEVVCLEDIENTGKLIALWIMEGRHAI